MTPAIIDGIRFCRGRDVLAGTADGPARFPRLSDLGCGVINIRYRLSGEMNDQGRPSLKLRITGDFELTCQRCLKSMKWALSSEVALELARSLEEIENAKDEQDRVLADQSMSVDALIEDEIILAVPMIPRHESCTGATLDNDPERQFPFRGLANLRRGAA